MTSGQDTWSARCVETRTAGAAGGPGKPTGSDPGRAPRSDPTGAFCRSALYPLLRRINSYLMRWLMNKYKGYRTWKKAIRAWTERPRLAAVLRPLGLGETGPPDDQDNKSRITGDRYVRICGSPGVRFPRATRPFSRPGHRISSAACGRAFGDLMKLCSRQQAGTTSQQRSTLPVTGRGTVFRQGSKPGKHKCSPAGSHRTRSLSQTAGSLRLIRTCHDHPRHGEPVHHRDRGTVGGVGPEVIRLHDGDRLDLRICPVRKSLGGAELRMLAYNGSIPGPTLHVDQGSEITVQVTNDGEIDTTVHWHGLRLENRYDGVPHETQAADPDRRDLHLPDPVSRRRLLLVSPAHPRGLRPGDGPLRHDRGRASRPVLLAARRPATGPHPGRPAHRGRAHRAVPPIRADLSSRWAGSATSC